MKRRYPELRLPYGESMIGYFPYPTPQKMSNGFYRITFQVGVARYTVFMSPKIARWIERKDPKLTERDLIKAMGMYSGVVFKVFRRDGRDEWVSERYG